MSDTSLGALLGEKPDTKLEAVTQQVEQPEVAATDVKPQPPEPSAEATEPTNVDGSPTVPRAALIDERRKRQDLEKRLEQLERMATQPPPQQPKPQVQRPQADWWTDPQAAAELQAQQYQAALLERSVVLSEELVSSQKPDYEEVKEAFVKEAARRRDAGDPSLIIQMVQHPLPAKFVYEQGVKIRALSEIGDDPASYKARLRAEWEAERAGQMQTSQPQVAPKPSAPKSLAETTSAVNRDPKGRFAGRDGPTPLEDIIG